MNEHLISLESGDWFIWKAIGVRGAGFSVDQLNGFRHESCRLSADRLIKVTNSYEKLKSEAIISVDEEIVSNYDQIHTRPYDNVENTNLKAKIKSLKKIKRDILKDQLSRNSYEIIPNHVVFKLLQELGELIKLTGEFEKQFLIAEQKSAIYVSSLVKNDFFKQAILWQNPALYKTVIAQMDELEHPVTLNKKLRQRLIVVAQYMQRYCFKNDTIGFFGPVGVGEIKETNSQISIEYGPSIIKSRKVYFEEWCVETIAKTLSNDLKYFPWIAPRVVPSITLGPSKLRFPFSEYLPIDQDLSLVLSLCDGIKTAREIAELLILNNSNNYKDESDVLKLLSSLVEKKIIIWKFEVPIGDLNSFSYIKKQIESISDKKIKENALQYLSIFEDARQKVEESTYSSKLLNTSISKLNTIFAEFTEKSPYRRNGEMYSARTLIYEDCLRDIKLSLNIDSIQSISKPLTIILNSAAWYCGKCSEIFRNELTNVYKELLESNPSERESEAIELTDFWLIAQSLFFGENKISVDSLNNQFHEKWLNLIGESNKVSQVSINSSSFFDKAEFEFPQKKSVWNLAKYHCPDLMIAAKDIESINNGNYIFVLGEVHASINSLMNSAFVEQHPNSDELLDNYFGDLGGKRIVTKLSREGTRQNVRTQLVNNFGIDTELLIANDACPIDKLRSIRSGQLLVKMKSGDLIAFSENGKTSFDVMNMFEEIFTDFVIREFKLFSTKEHNSRVTIDSLVIQRESWKICYQKLGFAKGKDRSTRFLEARRWAAEIGLPERVFVKVPWEQKPFFIDFSSPIYVEILMKQVRSGFVSRILKDTDILFTEALPDIEQVWLSDAQGNRYSSEFRLACYK